MKILDCLVAGAIMCCIHTESVQAQCVVGVTPTLLTYDSTVVGVGSAPYTFNFPKFDPTLGTLTSIKVQSVISLLYSVSIENTEAGPREVEHELTRRDRISSIALGSPDIISNFRSDPFGPYYLEANDNVTGSGADVVHISSVPVLSNDTLINRTIFNTANFLGTGNVSFNYTTTPGAGTSGATVNTFGSSITDIIKFNITYVYCHTLILASNKINLLTQNTGPLSATIKWNTSNESQAKSYEVMVSEDGSNFTTAAIMPASEISVNNIGNYQFKYDLASEKKKLFFRIKQVTKDNKVAVSVIRPVYWTAKSNQLQFILDPSGSNIDLLLPSTSTWQVSLLSINGQLIQANTISGVSATSLPIKQKLQKGIYVIRARNSTTSEQITQKIFIQ